jgi:hypothetical protein
MSAVPLAQFSFCKVLSIKSRQSDFALAALEDAGALPVYKRALAIDEKILGLEHFVTVKNLHDLGGLFA